MSRGPGRLQRDLAELIAAHPGKTFSTAELCAHVYPGELIEKKHRVAVHRAMKGIGPETVSVTPPRETLITPPRETLRETLITPPAILPPIIAAPPTPAPRPAPPAETPRRKVFTLADLEELENRGQRK